MVGVLELVTSIAGLIAFVETLLGFASELRSLSSDCSSLVNELAVLNRVLNEVDREFRESINLCTADARATTLDVLEGCIIQCRATCEDLRDVINRIRRRKAKKVRARIEAGKIKEGQKRLERDKSTLRLMMATITEQRQVIKQREKLGERNDTTTATPPPPPYSAGDSVQAQDTGQGEIGIARRVAGVAAVGGSVALGVMALNPMVSVPLGIAGVALSELGIIAGFMTVFS